MFRSALALVTLLATGATASAQTFGTFVWQTLPYCNRITLTLTTSPTGFTAVGADDGCGAPRKAPVTGTVVMNPNGTAGLRVSVAPPDGGRSVEISANVSTSTGSGTWSDAFGHSGVFALGGAALGLPMRPLAPVVLDIADNPATATDPCSLAGGRRELILCGSGPSFWSHSGERLRVWRDDGGMVHIRGALVRTTAFGGGALVVVLPPEFRPKHTTTVNAVASNGSLPAVPVVLMIFGPDVPSAAGVVQVETNAYNHKTLTLGEIVFTVDR